jgi:hypothetical protein
VVRAPFELIENSKSKNNARSMDIMIDAS